MDPVLDWLQANDAWLTPLAALATLGLFIGALVGWLRRKRPSDGNVTITADRGGIAAGRDANVGSRPARED